MVLLGYSPPHEFLSRSILCVCFPAIRSGMRRYIVHMSADPHLNHYFFLCSSAQPMIRGSQGLISSFKMKKKSSCGAVYLPGFDFQIPFSNTAELIIVPYLFKSLSLTSSLYISFNNEMFIFANMLFRVVFCFPFLLRSSVTHSV